MSPENTGAHWLDERYSLTVVELADLSGLSVTEVTELVECGVLAPAGATPQPALLPSACLATARTAARLRADFDLQPNGLALAVRLLGRIRELESQLRAAQARMPHYRR